MKYELRLLNLVLAFEFGLIDAFEYLRLVRELE